MIVAPLIWIFTIFDFHEAAVILFGIFLFYLRGRSMSSSTDSLLTTSIRRGLALCRCVDHRLLVALATLLPTIVLTWSNQFFESKRINIGVALIFVSPL